MIIDIQEALLIIVLAFVVIAIELNDNRFFQKELKAVRTSSILAIIINLSVKSVLR